MEREFYPAVEIGVASLVFWTVLHITQNGIIARNIQTLFQSKNPEKKEQKIKILITKLSTRLTGSLHNIIQIPFAIYLLLDEKLRKDPLYGSTPMSTLCMGITAGYFVVDLWICCRYFKIEGPLYLVHAISCLTLYTYGTFSGFLNYFGAGFLLWEVSTPFVHIRWLLKHLHKEDSSLYFANGILMLSTFFLFRCVWGVYLSISFWKTSAVELIIPRPYGLPFPVIWLYRIANIILNCLNFFWVTKMAIRALAFLKKKDQKKQ